MDENSRQRRKFCTITPKAWLCSTPLRELPFWRKTTPDRTSHTESLRQRTFERQSRAGELLLYGIVAITCPRARRSPLRKRTCLPPVPHSPCSPRSLAPFLKRPSRFPSWRKTVLRNGAKLRRKEHDSPEVPDLTQSDFRLAAVLVQSLTRFGSRRNSLTCGLSNVEPLDTWWYREER